MALSYWLLVPLECSAWVSWEIPESWLYPAFLTSPAPMEHRSSCNPHTSATQVSFYSLECTRSLNTSEIRTPCFLSLEGNAHTVPRPSPPLPSTHRPNNLQILAQMSHNPKTRAKLPEPRELLLCSTFTVYNHMPVVILSTLTSH